MLYCQLVCPHTRSNKTRWALAISTTVTSIAAKILDNWFVHGRRHLDLLLIWPRPPKVGPPTQLDLLSTFIVVQCLSWKERRMQGCLQHSSSSRQGDALLLLSYHPTSSHWPGGTRYKDSYYNRHAQLYSFSLKFSEIRSYFENSYSLDEGLFSAIKGIRCTAIIIARALQQECVARLLCNIMSRVTQHRT